MKDARNRQNKTEEEVNELTNKLKTLEVSSILEEGCSTQLKCALNLHRISSQIAPLEGSVSALTFQILMLS